MPEIVEKCPLCGQEGRSKLFDKRHFRGRLVVNQVCMNCGLVYQSPRMSDEELATFYEEEYRQIYQGTSGPTPKDLFVQQGRASASLDFVVQHLGKPQRLLDIGSSSGVFLDAMREHFGCMVVGIEPGKTYREYAQKQGMEIYASLDELKIGDESKFDLISMMHVLEHIPDPVAYLRMLRDKILHDKGYLLIEVPNLFAHDCFEIAHMTSFSAHTLKEVLKQAGFEVVAMKKHGYPRSKILPLYLLVLAKKGMLNEQSPTPERFVAIKRKIGMLKRRVLQKVFPKMAWVPLPKSSGDEN